MPKCTYSRNFKFKVIKYLHEVKDPKKVVKMYNVNIRSVYRWNKEIMIKKDKAFLKGYKEPSQKRNIKITIYFSQEEYQSIVEKILQYQLFGQSGTIRNYLLRKRGFINKYNPAIMQELKKYVRQLMPIGNNLNQIAKNCHIHKMLLDSEKEILFQSIIEIEKNIEKFRKKFEDLLAHNYS